MCWKILAHTNGNKPYLKFQQKEFLGIEFLNNCAKSYYAKKKRVNKWLNI